MCIVIVCWPGYGVITFETNVIFLIKLIFKRRLQHRCFTVKFPKFLIIPILKSNYERLLLTIANVQTNRLDQINPDTMSHKKINSFYISHLNWNIVFENSFFSSTILEWNKLEIDIRNSKSISILMKTLINHIWNSTSGCNNPKGVNCITKTDIGFKSFVTEVSML